jgi:hypothetical protein
MGLPVNARLGIDLFLSENALAYFPKNLLERWSLSGFNSLSRMKKNFT